MKIVGLNKEDFEKLLGVTWVAEHFSGRVSNLSYPIIGYTANAVVAYMIGPKELYLFQPTNVGAKADAYSLLFATVWSVPANDEGYIASEEYPIYSDAYYPDESSEEWNLSTEPEAMSHERLVALMAEEEIIFYRT